MLGASLGFGDWSLEVLASTEQKVGRDQPSPRLRRGRQAHPSKPRRSSVQRFNNSTNHVAKPVYGTDTGVVDASDVKRSKKLSFATVLMPQFVGVYWNPST